MYRSTEETMEKLKFPKLRISFNTEYNHNPISIQADGGHPVKQHNEYFVDSLKEDLAGLRSVKY
jgi:hypothetical protein